MGESKKKISIVNDKGRIFARQASQRIHLRERYPLIRRSGKKREG